MGNFVAFQKELTPLLQPLFTLNLDHKPLT